MSNYRIDTRAITVEVESGVGASVVGQVFLRPGVAGHSGAETVLDRLKDDSPFFPLRVENSGEPETVLIGKGQIRYVKAPVVEGDDQVNLERAVAAKVKASIILDTGKQLDGTLYVVLPPGQTRTLDFLNAPTLSYLSLSKGEIEWHINRFYVRYLRDSPADFTA